MSTPKGMGGQVIYTQDDRDALLRDTNATTHRKTARILAVQQDAPFMVHTDRGPMSGMPGDYLVTNHPDDDAGSDLWTISAERMANTYVAAPTPHPGEQHTFDTHCTACGEPGQLFVAVLGPDEQATISERTP